MLCRTTTNANASFLKSSNPEKGMPLLKVVVAAYMAHKNLRILDISNNGIEDFSEIK